MYYFVLRVCTVQVSGTVHYMKRYDRDESIIQIQHNTDQDNSGQDTWLVVQKQLTNASQVHVHCIYSDIHVHLLWCYVPYTCTNITMKAILYTYTFPLCTQFKAEVAVTEVALAFPLGADMKTVILAKVNIFYEFLLFLFSLFPSLIPFNTPFFLSCRTYNNNRCLPFCPFEAMVLGS